MKKFSLILSPHIPHRTKINVYELCKNGQSIFNQFFIEIEKDGNLFGNLAGAIRIVEDTSNLQRRSKSKFREIKEAKVKCKIYEAKSGLIRVYLIHEEHTGRIIITGGIKDDQKEDIKTIIKIIKDYYHEKQNT